MAITRFQRNRYGCYNQRESLASRLRSESWEGAPCIPRERANDPEVLGCVNNPTILALIVRPMLPRDFCRTPLRMLRSPPAPLHLGSIWDWSKSPSTLLSPGKQALLGRKTRHWAGVAGLGTRSLQIDQQYSKHTRYPAWSLEQWYFEDSSARGTPRDSFTRAERVHRNGVATVGAMNREPIPKSPSQPYHSP